MRSTLHILFYLVMLILCTILGFSLFKSGEIMPLRGHIERVERPAFNFADWFNSSYQTKMDKRTQNKFGFRSVFIRIKNQIDYTFFDEIHAREVVEGKGGLLYEEAYIKSYLGKSFIGEEAIIKKAERMKLLQDTLAQMDKSLIIVLAAGKATFYPDYFPVEYDTLEKTRNNYQAYHEQLINNKVDFIDFNDWFLQIKDTSQYLLYPKQGTHWSKYAECLVADSLIKYIDHKQQKDVPDLIINGIQLNTKPQFRDKDLEDGMNLIFDLDREPLAYPNFYFDADTEKNLNALIVADSYYWGLHNMYFSSSVFKEASFWFYNNDYYTAKGESGKVADLDTIKETLDSDVIILIATEATLDSFPWSYLNILYKHFERSDDL